MNAHRVMVLGVVAAVALGAALWSSQTRRPEQEPSASQPLVPGLEQGINDVTEVRVRTPGDVLQATLKRTEQGWVMVERDNYAVDPNLLREYLLKLARAKRIEAKTDNPASYYKIGVEDIADAKSAATQVEIDGLAQPVKLLIGRNVATGSGTYVRNAGDAQSWQADGDLAVEKVAANWLLRDLVDIAAGRIARVDVTPATGPKIEIARAAPGSAGDFVVANLPRGREAASEFVADATAGFLSGLRFDDVLRAADAPAPDKDLTRATFLAGDGTSIAVTAWQVEDKTRAQLVATLDEAIAATHVAAEQAKAVREYEALKAQSEAAKPAPPAAATDAATPAASATPAPAEPAAATPAPEPPLAVTDAAKDTEQRLAALRTAVGEMNARFSGKTFVLPSFKTSNLNKPLEDYLKPKA
jgi:hypothetical protein